MKSYLWSIALYRAEAWTLLKGQKYLENFEMWCCRIEKISWIDSAINEEVLR